MWGRNGLTYALAPVEDELARGGVPIVLTEDPLSASTRLSEKGYRPVVLYSLSTPLFAELWRELAQVAERFDVVVGGPHAAADPLTLLRLGARFVIIGDGEAAMEDLVRAWLSGEEPRPRNSVWLEDGKVRFGGRAYVELDRYRTFSRVLGTYPPIEIMRGCVYRCAFCQTWAMAPTRYRSVNSVAEMVREYVAAGKREIRFIAPVGFLYGSRSGKPEPDKLEELLSTVARLGGRPYLGTFPSETRPETVTDEVLRVVKRYVANRRLAIGLQSGSEKLLAAVKRGHDVAVVFEAVETARRHGFQPVVDILFGLPGEEEEDVKATVEAMESLVRMGARLRLHTFIPLPGTPLWGSPPGRVHPEYRRFVERWRGAVEGYWEEQEVLARRIYEAYEEVRRYLATRRISGPARYALSGT